MCRPEVVSCYPITPQSEVAESLSAFVADGSLDAEIVEVEGENSAMNVVLAASVAGARTFTATSSYGLVYMYDAMLQASGYRVPVVMVNVNRETPGIHAVSSGQQDMISTRDSGWVQIIVENNQEIVDQIIMSYRLAEDFDIQLPVMVNYDGYYLSYLAEAVEMPDQADVDAFLAPLKKQPQRPRLIPGAATGCGTHGMEMGYVEARYKHWPALERAKQKVDDIDKEFGDYFGRSYGGQIEEYKTADADIVIADLRQRRRHGENGRRCQAGRGDKSGAGQAKTVPPLPGGAADTGSQGQKSRRRYRPQRLFRVEIRAHVHGA